MLLIKFEGATTGVVESVMFYYNELTSTDWNNNIFNTYKVSKNILLKYIIVAVRNKLESSWDVELTEDELIYIVESVFEVCGVVCKIKFNGNEINVIPTRISDN